MPHKCNKKYLAQFAFSVAVKNNVEYTTVQKVTGPCLFLYFHCSPQHKQTVNQLLFNTSQQIPLPLAPPTHTVVQFPPKTGVHAEY